MRVILRFTIGVGLLSLGVAFGADSVKQPRPIPLTRPEMKELLEDMKARKPRIPLPDLTEEEKANVTSGGRVGNGYEGRLRSLYMPAGDGRGFGGFGSGRGPNGAGTGGPGNPVAGNAVATGNAGPGRGSGGGFGQNSDPKMTLSYAFKTQLFWIVSRTNNCQYCLGHQESKLLGAGLKEDEIAALDGDWAEFTPAERAAFALARKMTYEPHHLTDADIDAVRKHYNDLQILEMILSVAGNNSLNRWKEGVGVPQSQNGGGFGRRGGERGTGAAAAEPSAKPEIHHYLTPTSEKFQNLVSKVAPLQLDAKTGQGTHATVCARPALESRDEVERTLAAVKKRKPRLPLVDEQEARTVLGEEAPQGPLSQYVRLMCNFPREGKRAISSNRSADEKGDLTPLLKAQVSWIIARQDRAWYAVAEAQRRLRTLGQTDDQIYELDGAWEKFSSADRALFTVARQLAATPVVLTDEEVNEALSETGPRQVVQMISYTTGRAAFDRITEAAGLQVEE